MTNIFQKIELIGKIKFLWRRGENIKYKIAEMTEIQKKFKKIKVKGMTKVLEKNKFLKKYEEFAN